MSENVFQFSKHNPRVVTNMHKKQELIFVSTAAIFLYSMSWYSRRRFRVDKDIMKFTFFGLGSALSAYSWSEFLLSSSDIEAARRNNESESRFSAIQSSSEPKKE